MAQTFYKDPSAVLDYQIDWTAWLNGDTISTSAWVATSGVTVDTDSNTDDTATVWLSGGTAGETYIVTNHIVTAAGREDDRRIYIHVRDR